MGMGPMRGRSSAQTTVATRRGYRCHWRLLRALRTDRETLSCRVPRAVFQSVQTWICRAI